MPTFDDLVELITSAGLDPNQVSLEEVLAVVKAKALGDAGRAMAAIKFDKAPALVTREEVRVALADPETPGDRTKTGCTMRAGETAYNRALWERDLYDDCFMGWRAKTNRGLDRAR